jgi:serine/threonine-protein kinase
VYKCLDRETNTEIAIKIFNEEYVFQEFLTGENNRIQREIESLKRISHENVIKYIDDGSFIDNSQKYIYVAMEFLNGCDLKNHISTTAANFTEEIQIITQVFDGLDALHKNNVIHRDLKPENIYITNEGKVKLLDFGLSKIIDFSSITSTGAQIGSPLYMSPEQVRDSKNIDYRSDYYAAGVIFYELFSKTSPYGEVTSLPQLFYKILEEAPTSILIHRPELPIRIDSLLNALLAKTNIERPQSIEQIKTLLSTETTDEEASEAQGFSCTYYLRTWNERQALSDFLKDGNTVENVIFPINHQRQQKNLLKVIKDHDINLCFDPATNRLTYSTFADTKGLVELPYAPSNYNRLELDDIVDPKKRAQYLKLVLDEHLQYDPENIVTPFHISNNSEYTTIKNLKSENWFSIDFRLVKEAVAYLQNNDIKKKLIAGFSINTDILSSKSEREYFLNVLSSLYCDGYLIYVDCIDYNSSVSDLYNYVHTLKKLQDSTNRMVIAGRVGILGLLLNSFGIHGFETGAARFESFYEDLYKERKDSYNMYLRYYVPELFRSVPISRKDPSKLYAIRSTITGVNLTCKCPYCADKPIEDLMNDKLAQKHFLFRLNAKMKENEKLNSSEKLDKIASEIISGIDFYKALKPVFRPEDSQFLKNWSRIIPDLRNEFRI